MKNLHNFFYLLFLTTFSPNQSPSCREKKLNIVKNKKNQFGCSYSKNIANFEAFHSIILSSINLLYLKNDQSMKLFFN